MIHLIKGLRGFVFEWGFWILKLYDYSDILSANEYSTIMTVRFPTNPFNLIKSWFRQNKRASNYRGFLYFLLIYLILPIPIAIGPVQMV